MIPRELLEAFETLADAPDGVRRLRDLVLQLAVRGALVGNNQDRCLVGDGPHALPLGWRWAPIGELGEVRLGRQRAPDNHTGPHMVPYLRVANVHEGRIETSDVKLMNFTPNEQATFRLRRGDILLNEGQSLELIGRPAIYRDEVPGACFQNTLLRFRPSDHVFNEYALLVFRSYMRSGRFQASAQQTTNIAHLSAKRLAIIEFPLPPLAEQHRIVARVDELMGLLDRLEAARAVRDEVRRTGRDAALAALRDAEDTEAFELAWTRISGQMDALFDAPEDVVPLRQTILKLAVRGHLVPQDTRDEPAALALEAARQRRSALLSDWPESSDEGRALLRKLDRATPVSHVPYKMPSGWVCTTLLDSALAVVDCHNKTAPYAAEGVPILRTTNIRDGLVVFREMRFISEPTYQVWSRRCAPRPGDVVFTREAPMGQAAIIPEGLKACLGQRMMLIRPMDGISSNRYILLALLEPGVRERAKHTAVGMTVQHLRVGDVESLPIMLPPLAEQHRIVAKVDTLMALCDRLEARLAAARELQAKFAAAAVHHLDV